MDFQEEFNKLDIQKSFLIGLVVVGLYWVLLYDGGKGLDAQIAQAQKTVQKNRSALDKVNKALEDKEKFKKDIEEITLNMKDFQKYFSPKMDTNNLLTKVSLYAEENKIIVNNLKPVEKSSEFPSYAETAVEFQIEGTFHNIMEFISSLTKMEKAIDFSKMEFKTTVGGDSPLIELKTTLVVYSSNETIGEGKGG